MEEKQEKAESNTSLLFFFKALWINDESASRWQEVLAYLRAESFDQEKAVRRLAESKLWRKSMNIEELW